MSMIHGDVKPSNMNMAMQPHSSEIHLVIGDLGSARKQGTSETPCPSLTLYWLWSSCGREHFVDLTLGRHADLKLAQQCTQ